MTTFLPRQHIEARATDHWRRLKLQPGFDIDRLVDVLDLGVLWEPIDPVDGLAVAAELIAEDRQIRINEKLRELLDSNTGFYRFTLAHEIGHWELHCQVVRQGTQQLFETGRLVCQRLVFGRDATPDVRLRDAVDRRERQANLYASYLLAPSEPFRAAYREVGCEGWASTYDLADRLGLSVHATLVRLNEEKLGYRDDHGVPHLGQRPVPGQATLGL